MGKQSKEKDGGGIRGRKLSPPSSLFRVFFVPKLGCFSAKRRARRQRARFELSAFTRKYVFCVSFYSYFVSFFIIRGEPLPAVCGLRSASDLLAWPWAYLSWLDR